MRIYFLGYDAALWGVPRFCNPIPVYLPNARIAWAEGHYDACEDIDRPKVKPRLAAEFEVR